MPKGARLSKGMAPSEFNMRMTDLVINRRLEATFRRTCALIFAIPAKLNKEQRYLMKETYYLLAEMHRANGGNTEWQAMYITRYNGQIKED